MDHFCSSSMSRSCLLKASTLSWMKSDLVTDCMLVHHKPQAIKSNCAVLKFHSPYLHNLVGLTAEVLGTETGEEVYGH